MCKGGRGIFILSYLKLKRCLIVAERDGNLTDSERQLFEAQAKCLGFPSSYVTFTNSAGKNS